MGWSAEDIPSLEGRVALVTGANSGLGLESVRALAARGATVILACRSHSRAEASRARLQAQGLSRVDLLDLDLADLNSVERAAATVDQRYGQLDLLLNNAGVMAPPRTLTAQGHELQVMADPAEQQVLVLPMGPGVPLDLDCAATVIERVQLADVVVSDRSRWQQLDAVVVIPREPSVA